MNEQILTQHHTQNHERSFDSFIKINIKNSKYILKTIDTVSEFKEVLKLRNKIFTEEYGFISKSEFDIDVFDFNCDHLIIKTVDTHEVIATYRILCSDFVKDFYSSTEFEISNFLNTPGTKLELGRACIEKDHRKGSVLNLLWRGIIQYSITTKAEFLFGCSSIKTESYLTSLNINEALLRENKIKSEWSISPKLKYQFNELEKTSSEVDAVEIPPLLKSYLAAGANVHGLPAYDREFHCLDYLTILKLSSINETFERRYGNLNHV